MFYLFTRVASSVVKLFVFWGILFKLILHFKRTGRTWAGDMLRFSRNIPRAKSYDEGKDLAEHTGVLRLRGLPFSAGKDDIMEFFKDFVLSEDSIHITMNSEGRPTGEAFVEFANAEDSKAAMARDRMTLGSRYIELFPSSVEELDGAVSRGR